MYKSYWLKVLLALVVVKVYAVTPRFACKNQDGSLDDTFGSHGKVVTPIGIFAQAQGVVVLPCGDIVAAGDVRTLTTGDDFGIARYTPYGELNTSFGMNGIELTDFARTLGRTTSSFDVARAIALQKNCSGCDDTCKNTCADSCNNNCKLVVVGTSNVFGNDAFAVARYNCDGTLDTSFGINNSGVMVIPFGVSSGGANAVAIQENNKIVMAGVIVYVDGSSDFAVVRLNCDGTLDRTFGCDRSGIVLIDFGGFNDEAGAVKIQQDGKIVVAGYSDAQGSQDFALARLTANGRLDVTFGDKNPDGFGRTGKVLTDFSGNGTSNDRANALVLVEGCSFCCQESDLAIVAVGISGVGKADTFALAGYTMYGSLDRNFGDNGLVTTHVGGTTSSAANAALIEHGCNEPCKIVAGGNAEVPGVIGQVFALARYTLEGSLDTTFGSDGVVTTFFSDDDDIIQALALQENGDIVAAGYTIDGGVNLFALARYDICNPCCVPCGLVCAPCQPCR